MKSWLMLVRVVIIVAGIICAIGCRSRYEATDQSTREDERDKTRTFWGKYVTDDEKEIEDCLTKEYDLDDLLDFFEGTNTNEMVGSISRRNLYFSTVDKVFPVEIIRSKRYTIYKVNQGGLFYVFWSSLYTVGDDNQEVPLEPDVYFYTYILHDIPLSDYKTIVPWKSTAADIKELNPFMELDFVRSCGTFSYCYLNPDQILEIEFVNSSVTDPDELVVFAKRTLYRNECPSCYSCILSKDFPR